MENKEKSKCCEKCQDGGGTLCRWKWEIRIPWLKQEFCSCHSPAPKSEERCKHDIDGVDCWECYPSQQVQEEESKEKCSWFTCRFGHTCGSAIAKYVPEKEIIVHCDEKDCPECNIKAYNKGRQEAFKEGYEKCWQGFKDMDSYQMGRQDLKDELVREIKQIWNYPCNCERKKIPLPCEHNYDTMFSIISIIKQK